MTGAWRTRALAGGLAAIAGVVAVAAGMAWWESPHGVAWRWRGDLDGLRTHCLSPNPKLPGEPTPGQITALWRLAIDGARDENLGRRVTGLAALADLAKGAAPATGVDMRELKRVLIALLADRREIQVWGTAYGRRFRVCDIALTAAGRPGCYKPDLAETDRNCEAARRDLEKELAAP